ncbi:hypothetical protein BJY04DRAFT_177684 [Aspergillus karnatakaensis]|uniref:uncharacterized protein n=1 Tax=Aspergillus karnatakaensis TaxID=1810916 RepID=UPI003CCD0195
MQRIWRIILLSAIFLGTVSADCTANGCACRPGTAEGVYCGWCYAVTAVGTGGSWSDVFQCNSGGGCCRYGPRDSCSSSESYTPCG